MSVERYYLGVGMLRIFVDSGSSIKQEEKEKYGVDIIPLKIILGDEEYLDGVDLDIDYFYDKLINDGLFPKTSLPSFDDLKNKVDAFIMQGDDVIILTISSEISGTYNAIVKLFEGYDNVRVVDSRVAVGGMRLLVDEANKYRDQPLDFVVDKMKELIPRVKILATPETLDYLLKGGRLSKAEWLVGSLLHIKPVIGFRNGKVSVLAKKIGKNKCIKYLAQSLEEFDCDENYDIIASYTFNKSNIDELVSCVNEKYLKQIRVYDNLDPAIACHWGPNAFGFIFVSKK